MDKKVKLFLFNLELTEILLVSKTNKKSNKNENEKIINNLESNSNGKSFENENEIENDSIKKRKSDDSFLGEFKRKVEKKTVKAFTELPKDQKNISSYFNKK